MEAGSASEENSSKSVKRMSLSLPGNGYGNIFVDEREKNRTKRIYVYICLCFSEQNAKTVNNSRIGNIYEKININSNSCVRIIFIYRLLIARVSYCE